MKIATEELDRAILAPIFTEFFRAGFKLLYVGGCGTTDEYGISPEEDPVHVHDFHATILHLMGLDHEHLTYRHSGRDYRLTDVFGKVVDGVLS